MRQDMQKRDDWTARVQGWQVSGLSQRAYCAQAGLRFATFDYWRRRIAVLPEMTPVVSVSGAIQR